LIIGGTGQVGAAVVRALAAEASCAEVVTVNRKAISLTADPRLRQVILDTAAAQFPAEICTSVPRRSTARSDCSTAREFSPVLEIVETAEGRSANLNASK
jgi:nucleoside-diphosphate-sugar epimerase